MTIQPIPFSLLNDVVTLHEPTDYGGYRTREIEYVRVVTNSEITDRSAVNVRDVSEITVYYDYANSSPRGVSFQAGMLLEYNGVSYEIIRAETFSGERPHHMRITARKV